MSDSSGQLCIDDSNEPQNMAHLVRLSLNRFKASFSNFTLVCPAVNKLGKSSAWILTRVRRWKCWSTSSNRWSHWVLTNLVLTAVVTERLGKSIGEVLVLVVVGTFGIRGLEESFREALVGVIVTMLSLVSSAWDEPIIALWTLCLKVSACSISFSTSSSSTSCKISSSSCLIISDFSWRASLHCLSLDTTNFISRFHCLIYLANNASSACPVTSSYFLFSA